MIVAYSWVTTKRIKPMQYGLCTYRWKMTKWQGIFLFGIIPLVIWPISYEYSESRA